MATVMRSTDRSDRKASLSWDERSACANTTYKTMEPKKRATPKERLKIAKYNPYYRQITEPWLKITTSDTKYELYNAAYLRIPNNLLGVYASVTNNKELQKKAQFQGKVLNKIYEGQKILHWFSANPKGYWDFKQDL